MNESTRILSVKVNNGNAWKKKIEQNSHLFLVFLLLIWNR